MSGRAAAADENTLRVFVMTDTHLGYLEDDPVRGQDSFNTFEEMLKKARHHSVDFILHGGDLFHDNKPSRKAVHRTIELLRKYCLGDRQVNFSVLSDQSVNFPTNNKRVNYEDPNFNVEIPFFVVHGNHDDPAGGNALSAIDVLAAANLVNYFGKTESVDDICIYPILLQKGSTRLALYGLGNIRDERLYRTYEKQNVRMMRPLTDRDSWFNVFVLHQNRVAHSPKNYIHDHFLEEWIDMVIWGHEHECLIKPTSSAVNEFFISQPGSSVATSLSEGEAVTKQYGLLEVRGDRFRMRAHRLRTVRPLVLDSLVLSSVPRLAPDDKKRVEQTLRERVAELIEKGVRLAQETDAPLPPLVRLKVEYSGGFSTLAPARFGQHFVGKVANPQDILLFFKRRSTAGAGTRKRKSTKSVLLADDNADDEMGVLEALRAGAGGEQIDIESMMSKLMSETLEPPLALAEQGLNAALRQFVAKDDKNALSTAIAAQVKQRVKDCLADAQNAVPSEDEVHRWLEEQAAARRAEATDLAALESAAPPPPPRAKRVKHEPKNALDDVDNNNNNKKSNSLVVDKKPTLKQTKLYTSTDARKKRSDILLISDDDDDDDDDDNDDKNDNNGEDDTSSGTSVTRVKEERRSKRTASQQSTSSTRPSPAISIALKTEAPRRKSARRSSQKTSKRWTTQRK